MSLENLERSWARYERWQRIAKYLALTVASLWILVAILFLYATVFR